jgi:predicted protein tyrosine phosphatase
MTIYVCPLSKVSAMVTRHTPARVVSVLDPGLDFPELGPSYVGRHLRLEFHDINVPTDKQVMPAAAHIDRLLRFFERWDPGDSMLIHCRAGIGRSTAIAFIAACFHNPRADEQDIADQLRRISPNARPNRTLIGIADNAMERRGRMIGAIASTARNIPWASVVEGKPFAIPSLYPACRP